MKIRPAAGRIFLFVMKYWLLLSLLLTFALQAQNRVGNGRSEQIIQKAIANRTKNDPERKLETFSFKNYTKLIVTANPDSIRGQVDKVTRHKLLGLGDAYEKSDSTQYKLKQYVKRQHFFEAEKISQHQFDGKYLKETVTATKMSGFREPIYEVLGFNLQSFSLYGDNYELMQTKYNNPISDNALEDYNYRLIDSFRIEGRKVYEIRFSHKRKAQKGGLQGVLWIDAKT